MPIGPNGQWMPPQQQSVTQQAGNSGNPQSVQNFVTALNQTGAGGNNNFMNAPGQQGAQPTGGFTGFQNNGNPYFQGQAPQLGGQSYNPQMQYQGNMAAQGGYGQGPNPYAQQGNVTQGGTGGMQGQPQWQTPQAWAQTLNNAPGTPGSQWGQNQAGAWEDRQTTNAAAQSGAFYSGNGNLMWAPNSQPGSFAYTSGNPQANQPGQYMSNDNPNQGGYVAPNYTQASDVNSKTNIAHGEKELQEFLNSLGVYSYEYKDKQYGVGKRISPMAQEIEQTPIGKAAVSINPQGYKQVDYGKLAGTQLAALAFLNHKFNLFEKKLKETIMTNIKNKRK